MLATRRTFICSADSIGLVELFDKSSKVLTLCKLGQVSPPTFPPSANLLVCLDSENLANTLPRTVLSPTVVVGANRGPIRESSRQTTPTTVGLAKMEDCVDDFPHVQLPWSPDAFWARYQRCHPLPLVVRQVSLERLPCHPLAHRPRILLLARTLATLSGVLRVSCRSPGPG